MHPKYCTRGETEIFSKKEREVKLKGITREGEGSGGHCGSESERSLSLSLCLQTAESQNPESW